MSTVKQIVFGLLMGLLFGVTLLIVIGFLCKIVFH